MARLLGQGVASRLRLYKVSASTLNKYGDFVMAFFTWANLTVGIAHADDKIDNLMAIISSFS